MSVLVVALFQLWQAVHADCGVCKAVTKKLGAFADVIVPFNALSFEGSGDPFVYVDLDHTCLGDLSIWLEHADMSKSVFFEQCDCEQGMRAYFFDNAVDPICPNLKDFSQTQTRNAYSDEMLQAFKSKPKTGVWNVLVHDHYEEDNGTLKVVCFGWFGECSAVFEGSGSALLTATFLPNNETTSEEPMTTTEQSTSAEQSTTNGNKEGDDGNGGMSVMKLAIAIGSGFLLLLCMAAAVYYWHKNKKLTKQVTELKSVSEPGSIALNSWLSESVSDNRLPMHASVTPVGVVLTPVGTALKGTLTDSYELQPGAWEMGPDLEMGATQLDTGGSRAEGQQMKAIIANASQECPGVDAIEEEEDDDDSIEELFEAGQKTADALETAATTQSPATALPSMTPIDFDLRTSKVGEASEIDLPKMDSAKGELAADKGFQR